MVYREKSLPNGRSYRPSPELLKSLEDRLQTETKRPGKKAASESNRMSRRKNHYLNKYVFPSMANVVAFLEYASKKELRRVFDKDVKELLLSESSLGSEKYRRPTFRRLIHAALSQMAEVKGDRTYDNVLQEDYEEIKPDDFKYLLAEMAQKEIGWMMLGASSTRFGSDGIAQSLMKPDMGRAENWLNLLSNGVSQESKKFDSKNRPVLF